MKSVCVVLISILFLSLSGCLFQKDVPEITIGIENPPEELIVSDTFELLITLANEGGAAALNVKVESNIPALLTFEVEEIQKIEKETSREVKGIIRAADILKEKESAEIEAIVRVKYYDAKGDQRIARDSFTFILRKPVMRIEKVEAGLLPGKITIREKEKIPISVSVKNAEERKLENLYIVFCSEYANVSVYRLDIEKVGSCFEYRIQDVLWYNDVLTKGFTMEASLPTGARQVSFVVVITLVWRPEGYEIVLDTEELRVDVEA